jgi:hypothetical protein
MVFVKRVTTTDSAGRSITTKQVEYVNLAMAMVILFIILAAAFYANSMAKPWEAASGGLLTAFTSGIGLVIGALLGEGAG